MRGCPSGVHDRLARRAEGWTRGAAAVTLAVILVATMVVLLARPYPSPALTAPTVPSVPTPTVTVPAVTVPPVTVPTSPPVTVTPPKPPPVTMPVQAPAIHTPTVATPSVPGATSPTRVPSVGTGLRPNVPAAQGIAGAPGRSASSQASTSSGATSSSSSLSAGSSTAGSPMAVRSTGASRDRHGRPAGSGAARRHKRPLLSDRRLRRLVSLLKGCLPSLFPRQSNVLILRTGLGLKHAYSRRQVARILHVTLQQEGKAERQAVSGLRRASAGGRCVSAQSSVPKAVARTVSLLASTNELGPTGNTTPGAVPGGSSARRQILESQPRRCPPELGWRRVFQSPAKERLDQPTAARRARLAGARAARCGRADGAVVHRRSASSRSRDSSSRSSPRTAATSASVRVSQGRATSARSRLVRPSGWVGCPERRRRASAAPPSRHRQLGAGAPSASARRPPPGTD